MTTINVKIGLYGDSDVGKSTLITYLQTNKFKPTKDITIGVDYYTAEYNIQDTIIKFQIWDTAGQERYNSIITKYYTVNVPIFMFDVSAKDSFTNLDKWIERYHENKRYDPILLHCIGNKTDLGHKIESADIVDFCKNNNLQYHENSYINNNNIDHILSSIATEIHRLHKNDLLHKSNLSIDNIITFEGYTRFNDRVSVEDSPPNLAKNIRNCCK